MLPRNPHGQRPCLSRLAMLMVCLPALGLGPLNSAADGARAAGADAQAPGKATADAHGDPLPASALARLGTTRLRHEADVTFVAFGPDGNTLLTAGQDNTIRLWDLASGKEIRRFARPRATPAKGGGKVQPEDVIGMMAQGRTDGFSVALAPDGKTLAAASGNLIQLWQSETGKELRTIQAASGLTGLLFSPDGRTLAGRAQGGTIFLWAADTGKEIHQLKPPPRPASNTLVLTIGGGGAAAVPPNMAFTPDGKTLAAAGTDYQQQEPIFSVKFWDVASGKESRKIELPRGASVSGVAIAPGGKILAYGTGDVVHLCDAETGKELRQLKVADGGILALAFSPDTKTLVVRGRNQRVRLWETATGKEHQQLSDAEPAQRRGGAGGGLVLFSGGPSGPEARVLAISPDGKRLASVAGSTVRIWELATGKELPLLDGHRRPPSAIALTKDGTSVVSWGTDRVIRRWEAATGKPLGAFPAPPGTTLAAFAPDGRTIALANADNSIRLHDATTGKEVQRLKGHPGGATALAFAPDGKRLASRGGDTIRLYDLARGAELRQITMRPGNRPAADTGVIVLGGPPRAGSRDTGPGLAFSPDGNLVVAPAPGSGIPSKVLTVFDATTGRELRKIESLQPVASFAFSPDGRTLATENADRTIAFWEIASGKERTQMGKPVAQPAGPDKGRMGVTVLIEGISAGPGEPAGPVGLSFSPDGRALAVRGPDLSVRVWDVGAAREIAQFKGHTGRVETVAFTADGKGLASAATDTTILLWDVMGSMKGLSRPQPVELPATQAEELWNDLASADAAKGFRAILKLAAAPDQAVPWLGERLKPAARVDPQKIDRWTADLASEKFAARQEATANLLKAGEQALPALKKALAAPLALEPRKRVEHILDQLIGGTFTPEQLRMVRAVEVLERIGSAPARRVLEGLVGGAPGALPTREAQAALDRLAAPRP